VARRCPSADGFLPGSSRVRATLRWFLSRTGDEKPHRNPKYAYLCAPRCGQIPPSGRHINGLLVEPVGHSSEPFGQPEKPMRYKTLTESKTATIIPSDLQARCNYHPFAIAGRGVARKEVWEWAWGAPSGAFHPPAERIRHLIRESYVCTPGFSKPNSNDQRSIEASMLIGLLVASKLQ